MKYKKKLIEVALPLDEINKACVKEKGTRNGHPSSLHQWWARRPLASVRAIIISQLIDDPLTYLDEKEALKERKKIHKLISKFVYWDNAHDRFLIDQIRKLILESLERNGKLKLNKNN